MPRCPNTIFTHAVRTMTTQQNNMTHMATNVKFDQSSARYNLPGKYIAGVPLHKLQRNADFSHLPPAVLVECGSFSPMTTFHLQLFELDRDHLMIDHPTFNVVGGIVSPVHDAYGKKSLVPQHHRIEMCRLALESSNWIAVADWEASQPAWTRTRAVLDHIAETISPAVPGVRVLLCMGSDVLESFLSPGLWATEDMHTILTRHGVVVTEREGVDLPTLIAGSFLSQYKDNIHIVPTKVRNNVSSTLVRERLQKGQSVKWLVPDSVAEYVVKQGLYGATCAYKDELMFK